MSLNRSILAAPAPYRPGDNHSPLVRQLAPEQILEWAMAPEPGGGLPKVSAEPFTRWLETAMFEYASNGDGEVTNGQILEAARKHWCGEAGMRTLRAKPGKVI